MRAAPARISFLRAFWEGAKALERIPKPIPAALGFRVDSGWAMTVLLVGPRNAPKLVTCRAVLLSDPKIPQSKQPCHAARLPLGLRDRRRDAPVSRYFPELAGICSLLERFARAHSLGAPLLPRRSGAQQPKTAGGPADSSLSWGPSTCGRVPCVFPRRSIGTRHTKESRIQECKTPEIMWLTSFARSARVRKDFPHAQQISSEGTRKS
jgi:hypothetical protein